MVVMGIASKHAKDRPGWYTSKLVNAIDWSQTWNGTFRRLHLVGRQRRKEKLKDQDQKKARMVVMGFASEHAKERLGWYNYVCALCNAGL
ncbi:hypothetical protein ACF0H5_011986 [Mactra antiquata]